MSVVMLTIAVEFPDGGMSSRSWPIDRERAERLAAELGEPFMESVFNEREVVAGSQWVEQTEMPRVMGDQQ